MRVRLIDELAHFVHSRKDLTYRRSMQCADIAPDRARSLSPMHPCDTVMIPRNQTQDILPDHLILVAPDPIDLANVQTHASK